MGKVALRRSGFALHAKRVMGQRGKKFLFFFAFLRVSEHFDLIETHFFFQKFSLALSAKRARAKRASEMQARSLRERSDRVAPQGELEGPRSGPVS